MDVSTITHAKNHLPKLIHAAEAGDDIRISRHGKLIAVIISAERYQQHFNMGTNIFQSIMQWREKQSSLDLTDAEIDSWRDHSPAREFTWD